ncbi:hypothetical protein AXK11_07360 [Cephaloticoccus primus]|uniref:Uncharacterized protein n=1 Tax=Cephaloticoccus primus TaxID=1548207 RepID=A0A139SKS9_9BACT|nr:hypothetical protein AXK11_07360 [Cephaloticoccus primus]
MLAVGVAALALLFLLGLFAVNVGDGEAVGTSARGEPLEKLPASGAAQARTVGLRQIKRQVPGEADLVAAEALFFDPSPLFLPTPWNAGQARLPELLLQEVEELFGDYAAQLHFAREGVGADLPGNADATAARSLALGLTAGEEGARLLALGRRGQEPPRLSARAGRVEVISPQRAEPVITAELRELGAAAAAAGNWRPLELAALVNEVGLVGGVQLVQSSGVEAVDEFFRDYVVRRLHLGERVEPGLYRILIGP